MTENNPYAIDTGELAKQQKENSMGSTGIFCPKRNNSLDGDCAVCEYIGTQIYVKKYPDGHPARKFAGDKKAKASIFVNMVLPSDPNTAITLEMGSQAAGNIIEGVEKKGWTDIIDPRKGMGRELQLTKGKGDYGFPKYSVSPVLDKADWEIDNKVLDTMEDLSQKNIIERITNGEYSDSNEKYLKASTLKMGETLNFRLCPPWSGMDEEGINPNKRFMTWVFRHWGVTQGQIDGTTAMDWRAEQTDNDDDAVSDTQNTQGTVNDTPEPSGDSNAGKTNTGKKQAKTTKEPPCIGQTRFFEADSKECMDCSVFKRCMQEVIRKEEGGGDQEIPF